MTDVDRIYEELSALVSLVQAHGGPSDNAALNAIASKTLLISAASHFERSIGEIILRVAKESGTQAVFLAFIEKQALERRFHSMFNWEGANLNKFFALFGVDAKRRLADAAQDQAVATSIRDFLFLNAQRNLLAHENYAGASVPATFEEVWVRYRSAERFAEWFENQLRELAVMAAN